MMARTRLYLAGSSTELGRIQQMARRIDETGLIEIPHRWWDMPGIGHDDALSDAEQAEVARLCFRKLKTCEFVWWLAPAFANLSSSPVEFGYALGLSEFHELTVFSSGGSARQVALTASTDEHPHRFGDDEAAFRFFISAVGAELAVHAEVT